jgi:hypothetical protein
LRCRTHTVVDVSVIHPAAATYAARAAAVGAAALDRQSATATSRRTLAAIPLCLCSGDVRAHGCACDGAAQHALNPCVCPGTVVRGLSGECLARAQCEPVQGHMFRAGLMVTARCSIVSKKAILCLVLLRVPCRVSLPV